MSTKLFVGGLSPTTTDEMLRAAFGSHGELREARVILDRETGRSRGFGFVRFATPDQAEQAMTALTGTSLDGRPLRIDLATERATPVVGRTDRPESPRGPGGRAAPRRDAPLRDAGGARRLDGPVDRPGMREPFSGPRRESAWAPPVADEEAAGWEEARMPRRTEPKRAKRRVESQETGPRHRPAPRQRRSSGQSWRAWAVEAEDDE